MTALPVRLAVAAWLALAASAPAAEPYVPEAQVPDGIALLPPPPAPGSAAARADREIFLATRKLKGSARWRIATDDVTNAPLDRYACAIGMTLTPMSAPALATLLDRIGTGDLVGRVKAHYETRRPYLADDAPICEPKTPRLAANGDYPSGHAANGWLEALVLAQILPDQATALLTRARAYGESRAICGSHSASAVSAGWLAGSAMFAVLQASPAFQRDLAAARDELATLAPNAAAADAARCAAEQAVLSAPAW